MTAWPPSSSGGRFVGALNQPTVDSIGLLGASSAVSTTNTGGSYGSWVQMTASLAAESYVVGIAVAGPLNADLLIVDVGIGASGSETTLARAAAGMGSGSGANLTLPVPLRVGAGQRLAVRAATNQGGAGTLTFFLALLIVPVANVAS